MATYYRWRKSTIQASETVTDQGAAGTQVKRFASETVYMKLATAKTQGGYSLSNQQIISNTTANVHPSFRYDFSIVTGAGSTSSYVYGFSATNGEPRIGGHISGGYTTIRSDAFTSWKEYLNSPGPGTPQGYVYSTSSSAYPNGGVSGSYYYDQRTKVTSPTAPTGLTYPATITALSVSVSWTAATSNVPNYQVSGYQVDVSTNGGTSWTTAGTPTTNSLTYSITPGTTSIMFRVRAKDSNGQWGSYVTGTASQVLLAPTLTVPQMVMQGQQATISWSAIEGADSYTLQRKSSADTDWTQVYSGTDTTFTETVGTWTSLQYRVQAVFDGTPGGWATSDSIQIVSASALVISGQDGDLGTLVNDVPYSISSDQTSPTIDVTVEVNGGEYAAFQATSGQTYTIGVLDLPTGTGSIVITATTTVSESPVTVTRTWTYSKTAQTFPNSGSVATLTKESNVVYPETLVEAVRASMTPWGGNLSTALELLKRAALFNRTKQPKYSEVTISLPGKTEGQTIQLPENGRMVEFYVAKLDYEEGLNGTGRVLVVRKDCYDQRAWDSDNVNAYANSDLDSWFNSTYKNMLDADIRSLIGTTKIRYTPGNGNWTVVTLERAVFALSATELGQFGNWFNVEGSALPIANTLKVAHLNGSTNIQWTRSPGTDETYYTVYLDSHGSVYNGYCFNSYGSRPAFTLPNTFTATYYVGTDGSVHASQEYTEAGDWLDVWGNVIPAVKIATGSYVGTGTHGQSNPNTLTFPFEPKFVFVYGGRITSGSPNPSYIVTMLNSPNYPYAMALNDTVTAYDLYTTFSGNEVSWYTTTRAEDQLNQSQGIYNYVAIG